ncbi:hypothetical protein BKA56DRAFT_668339 [Ilyonectria sp. MPI-CAGE-AT-0026]|nr:hypothetical protein BKA56DRAFT_668339 [Ilyonectria sp. MPI-CAGE-AT-0026]
MVSELRIHGWSGSQVAIIQLPEVKRDVHKFNLPFEVERKPRLRAVPPITPANDIRHLWLLVFERNSPQVYAVLGVDDWLDDFLLSMKPSTMRLKSSPEDGWALLHEDDYLGNWIRKGLGGSQMAINGQGPALRIETAQGLIFNTEATSKALGTNAVVSSDGLSPWT